MLFSCIRLVKGFTNSLMIDLQTERMLLIDNELYEFLSKSVKLNNKYKSNTIEINNIISFFTENNWGFITDSPESFPDINLNFEFPAIISNMIIDINNFAEVYSYNIITSLNNLIVNTIQFRIFCKYTFDDINKLIEIYSKSNVNSFEIVLTYIKEFTQEQLENLLQINVRLFKIFVTNAQKLETIEYKSKIIKFINYSFNSCKSCGNINQLNFHGNMFSFTEALNHNSCLFAKMSIDENGDIKNCPSMNYSYGNIRNVKLENVLNEPNFKTLWGITKDKINVCKDCEFRYVCTDCRAYLEDPSNIFSKPLKCGYNPYTAEWSEWSTNPLKQKAIKFYGMEELVAVRAESLSTKESESD